MIRHYLFSLATQVGQFEGAERGTAEALGIASGIFALLLFSLSMYAWSRRSIGNRIHRLLALLYPTHSSSPR
jgi:hypothetical protein